VRVSILPITARLLANLTGATKMVKDINEANRIVGKMAKERYRSSDEVLAEFMRYQKDGECQHFWPDENTACRMLLRIGVPV
jgi:hypothetical protein